MVITQYPHYIYVLEETSEARQLKNGDWVPGEQAWVSYGNAREETNGRGSVYRAEDYCNIVTTALVQCPTSCQTIEEGATILVSSARIDPHVTEDQIKNLRKTGIVRVTGTCKKFDRTSMHCRVWL